MRKRERDQTADLARRRLQLLQAELAGIGSRPPGSPVATVEPLPGEPDPLRAGPPGGLEAPVLYAAQGRPLPPEPAVVGAPGRHAVPRRGPVPDWVDERVPARLRGRIPMTGQHLTLLAGALAVALLVTGWMTLRGPHQSVVPAARFSKASASAANLVRSPSGATEPAGATPAAVASGSASGSGSGQGSVVVDVAGKVRHPGVVTLPSGARVQDAIARAGGLRPGARTQSLNLARVLVDGEQILVDAPGAAAPAGATGVATSAGSSSATGSDPGAGGMVSLNTADQTQLEALPGVGPVTAQKILAWRTSHGAFTSVDELLEVDGIGDKTLADIAPHATL